MLKYRVALKDKKMTIDTRGGFTILNDQFITFIAKSTGLEWTVPIHNITSPKDTPDAFITASMGLKIRCLESCIPQLAGIINFFRVSDAFDFGTAERRGISLGNRVAV